MSASTITISEATVADLSVLSVIITAAHMPEAVMPFFFADWPQSTNILTYYAARLRSKWDEGETKFIKATDNVTGQILGMVLMSSNSGDPFERPITNPGAEFVVPPGFDWKFAGVVTVGLKKLDDVMIGRKYYALSSLAVTPSSQGRGVGTQLINYCITLADKVALPIYLSSFPGAHDLYLRFGWTDKEHFDIDLNEWGKKNRGFGIYRAYGMIRELPEKISS